MLKTSARMVIQEPRPIALPANVEAGWAGHPAAFQELSRHKDIVETWLRLRRE